ncbi:MAG: tetratricopeptide repeat protein, partial [Candidatus Omnitrophota bacterium]|nr:tetratricopeptide repeat protein [Candidatus Omnitrophota bacterium]
MLIILSQKPCFAEDKKAGPDQLFYAGNGYYEKQDYANAIKEYAKIKDAGGLESGPLYYNIGNAFLKLGKTGHAILYYERAKRLMPHDSDLKSNLAYARSLVGDSSPEVQARNLIVRTLERPFRNFSLKRIAVLTILLYFIAIFVQIIFVFMPVLKRRFGFTFALLFIIFLFGLAAFSIRYYEEKILEGGIIILKDVECKYEPIDKSTTYYTLQEGSNV